MSYSMNGNENVIPITKTKRQQKRCDAHKKNGTICLCIFCQKDNRCMECGTHECSDGCIEYLTDGVL